MNPPLEGDSTDPKTPGVTGRNTATTDTGFAMGIHGTSDRGEGVRGETNAPNHAAVAGFNNTTATGSIAQGVWGSSQVGEGVHGETNSTTFAAVAGIELNPSSNIAAVYGEQRGGGPGVFGIAKGAGGGVWGTSAAGEGVHGDTNAPNHAAVAGTNTATAPDPAHTPPAWGVWGHSEVGEGVHGETNSTTFAAVAGIELNPSSNIAAVYGEQRGGGPGVFGIAKGAGGGVWGTSAAGEGVHGDTNAPNHAAVAGTNTATAPDPAHTPPAWGVWGHSEVGEGVHGETNSLIFAAVAGITLNANGTGAGIYGQSGGLGPAAFFQGNVVVTGDVQLINADCAEDFEIANADRVEPGTVMVLGEGSILQPSQFAYDKRVTGVISGAGSYKPGIVLDKQGSQPNRKPVALVGKVYCKVDAQYGAVETGDLLTTSPTPGHAMKATDQLKAFGAVIGKALRPLTAGQGLIPILVALQ